MSEPIPVSWKRDVIRLLDDPRGYRITKRALLDFQSLFPGAFPNELGIVFRKALRNPDIHGKRIHDAVPPGETYAFWIKDEETRLYGKLTLLEDHKSVFIISAHIPLKGNEL